MVAFAGTADSSADNQGKCSVPTAGTIRLSIGRQGLRRFVGVQATSQKEPVREEAPSRADIAHERYGSVQHVSGRVPILRYDSLGLSGRWNSTLRSLKTLE